jgi:hypothetical protein
MALFQMPEEESSSEDSWGRPALENLHLDKENLIFQQLDIDHYIGTEKWPNSYWFHHLITNFTFQASPWLECLAPSLVQFPLSACSV